jgi:PAS domain S-box-containing protein
LYRILYVDDEPALLEIGKLFLEQSGQFIVDTSTSAPAALTLVKTTNYDAIISDYQMPKMDGIEFLKRIRCLAKTIPFILFTGRGREEIVIQALNEGADFYIQKGGEPRSQFAELSNKIRYAVIRRNTERDLLQKNEDLNAAYEELTATDESLRQSYDELSKKEEVIRASEEKFRAVVELSLDAFFIVDFSGNLLFANTAMGTILDVADYRTMIGTWNVMEFIAPESQDEMQVDFDSVAQGIDRYLVHYKIVTDQKRKIRVECIGQKVVFEGSDAILVSMRDITERKLAEEALVKKNEELNASYEQIAASDEELRSGFDELTRQEIALRESERRFRELSDLLPLVVFEVDLQGNLTYVNRIGFENYGCTDEDIRKGLNVTQMLAPGDVERATASLRAVVAGTKKPEPGLEFMARRIDGSTFPVAIYSSPIVVNGRTTGFRGIVADITEYKQAYAALHESEERYRNVVEDQTEFISRFLPDGTHVFVNEAYCRYFGMKRDDILGHRFRPKVPPEDRERMNRFFVSLSRDHPIDTIEHRIIMPDDSIRWQRWSDRAIFDSSGTITEYQSVGQDITERKRAEESLCQANRKLTLLASISRHDINNQLLTLRGFLDLLHREVPDPALEHYFSRMATASDRISAMIQFTREYESIGVNAPVWQEVSLLADSSSKDVSFGQIRLMNDLPHGIEIYADPLIGGVFFNLMDNAVRHGGTITTIRFSVEERDDRHIVVCEDDGDGVAAEEKEQIFDRGFGKNTGMGLFLVREILSITGIAIRETGEPGKGARFEMTVPKGAWRISDKK